MKQFLHRAAAADDSAELIALFDLRSQVRDFRLEPPLLQRLVENVQQLVELKGLGDKVRRTPMDGFDGVLHGPIPGDHNGDDPGIPFSSRFDDPGPVDPREAQVGDQNVEGKLIQILERFFPGVGLNDFESTLRESLRHQPAQGRLIVYEQQVK